MDTIDKQVMQGSYTRDQLDEIEKGKEAGVDVKWYENPKFLAIQMQQIRLGLMEGLQVECYANPEYDWFQMEEIRKGLKEGVDISLYASADITYDRMQQIRLGLREGIDLAFYKRLDAGVLKQMRLAIKNKVNIVPFIIEGYDPEQLEAIREALEKGIDITDWVKKEFRGVALSEIFQGLEHGLDVAAYAKTEYTWMQMHEIRIGMEHMVDIAQYTNVYYSSRQMREIRKGLEAGLDVSFYRSLMYTASEMRTRRKTLEKASEILTQNTMEIPDIPGVEDYLEMEEPSELSEMEILDDIIKMTSHYEVTVSDDEMEAYLDTSGIFGKPNRFDIVKALQDKNICYGILYDLIDEIVKGNSPKKQLLIAKGKRPVNGEDGWYEYFFKTDFLGTPKELENGNLDYRDISWYETVEKGQKLAEYHSAEKGEDGISVTGKAISARKGREKGILLGKGFKKLTDGKTYIADLNGVVTLKDNLLNVSELLVLKEVSPMTGNVVYDGNILVEGNVSSGSIIRATKDITVYGFVEDAQIISGGSVFLRKGMNGTGGGSIRAAYDVIGYFFEETEIYAGDSIQADYFFRSTLHSNGMIKAVGKKGVIAGGWAAAEKGVIAKTIGNEVDIPTYIKLGRLDNIKKKQTKIDEAIASAKQELSRLQNVHEDYNKKYSPEIRNSMELYLKIESAIYTKELQLQKLAGDRQVIEEELRRSSEATAIVSGTLYEGVTIEIDGSVWKSINVRNVTVRKMGGKITRY